jgi:hypothetical protein
MLASCALWSRRLTKAQVDEAAALRAWLAEILGIKAVTIRIVATSRPERSIKCRMDNLGRSVKQFFIRVRVLSKTFVYIRVSVYTINEVCERIFLSIPTFRRQVAIRIVQLLLYSSRPLKVSKLLDASEVDNEGDISFDKSRWPTEAMDIAVYCSSLTFLVGDEEVTHSLIKVRYRWSNNSEPILQLAHLSVKEYR